MSLDNLIRNEQAPSIDVESHSFSSSRWLAYFNENKEARPNITFQKGVAVSESLRMPLIRSLQKFQIGETGEGKHLRKFAATLHDPDFEKCIDLFIKEEQFHARVLAQMISAMDGTLLSWHWSDVVFIVLRRMLGLKTELLILLIAEIIGKCFYRLCAQHLKDERMSDAFSLIVLDEIGHLEFHCAFLRGRLENTPLALRKFVLYAWSFIFHAACIVFILDHKKTLSELEGTPQEFKRDCSLTFKRCAARILAIAPSRDTAVSTP